ncbi:hypothetical protein WR25_10240 [Diploscapter pachys]|uniref:CUB domain-containing protein n=1 Tax=Diploscapter pachys TaxID=2018661 RepID=A0A2A2KCV5_9BILA|nr:hypothetical protein WR25_10240 [Diploscapter pachys]
MSSLRLFPFFLLILQVSGNVINYVFHDANGDSVNDCVEKAMEILMEETCLFFRSSSPEETASVTFIESGHCGWQEQNRTVHLGSDCISEDVCFELIGRVLNANQPRLHISRHINLHYNCTEKCTTACEHGGEILDDCSCKCPYGFKGERCQDLTKLSSFTDGSCGIVNADNKGGYVKLSTYPGARPKVTFCQWLVRSEDPWSIIDAEIEDLGLDNMDIGPNQHCNDILNVYGTNDVKGP